MLLPVPPRLVEYQQLRARTDRVAGPDAMRRRTGCAARELGVLHGPGPGWRQLAAMGRVIGDGGWCFTLAELVDLAAVSASGTGRPGAGLVADPDPGRAPAGASVTAVADAACRRLLTRAGFRLVAPHLATLETVPGPR